MKIYKVKKEYKGRETIIERTLPELISYFSYTLEIGHSWNKKIQENPKTIKSFISNLEKAFEEKEGGCYERTSITLL